MIRKILMSIKVFAHSSRAGNGCANFMGAWDFFGSFCRKTSMLTKLLGGVFGVLGGGRGKCQFYCYGCEVRSEDFLIEGEPPHS